MKFRKMIALTLTAAIAISMITFSVSADDNEKEGEAGIDFKKSGTIIPPPDDNDLPDVKNTNIYFGEQDLTGETKTYNSVNTHNEEPRQHAGFKVSAGNTDGWNVTVQISEFKLDGVVTMENFSLELLPGDLHKIEGNVSEPPTANRVVLTAEDQDVSVIFEADGENDEGLGKWGCNWEGNLKVIGGSVTKAGSATATMLWTLETGTVTP